MAKQIGFNNKNDLDNLPDGGTASPGDKVVVATGDCDGFVLKTLPEDKTVTYEYTQSNPSAGVVEINIIGTENPTGIQVSNQTLVFGNVGVDTYTLDPNTGVLTVTQVSDVDGTPNDVDVDLAALISSPHPEVIDALSGDTVQVTVDADGNASVAGSSITQETVDGVTTTTITLPDNTTFSWAAGAPDDDITAVDFSIGEDSIDVGVTESGVTLTGSILRWEPEKCADAVTADSSLVTDFDLAKFYLHNEKHTRGPTVTTKVANLTLDDADLAALPVSLTGYTTVTTGVVEYTNTSDCRDVALYMVVRAGVWDFQLGQGNLVAGRVLVPSTGSPVVEFDTRGMVVPATVGKINHKFNAGVAIRRMVLQPGATFTTTLEAQIGVRTPYVASPNNNATLSTNNTQVMLIPVPV